MAANGDLKVGYADSIVDGDSKNRYMEKLKFINGQIHMNYPSIPFKMISVFGHQLLTLMCVSFSF